MNKKEVLGEAANWLEGHEWYKSGDFGDHGVAVCIIGAVAEAINPALAFNDSEGTNSTAEESKLFHQVWRDLSLAAPDGSGNIIAWNDEVAKSKQEVVTFLREQAELA